MQVKLSCNKLAPYWVFYRNSVFA